MDGVPTWEPSYKRLAWRTSGRLCHRWQTDCKSEQQAALASLARTIIWNVAIRTGESSNLWGGLDCFIFLKKVLGDQNRVKELKVMRILAREHLRPELSLRLRIVLSFVQRTHRNLLWQYQCASVLQHQAGLSDRVFMTLAQCILVHSLVAV